MKTRHLAGVATLIGQADARRAVLSAQADELDARQDRLTAFILLQKSLGLGWKS